MAALFSTFFSKPKEAEVKVEEVKPADSDVLKVAEPAVETKVTAETKAADVVAEAAELIKVAAPEPVPAPVADIPSLIPTYKVSRYAIIRRNYSPSRVVVYSAAVAKYQALNTIENELLSCYTADRKPVYLTRRKWESTKESLEVGRYIVATDSTFTLMDINVTKGAAGWFVNGPEQRSYVRICKYTIATQPFVARPLVADRPLPQPKALRDAIEAGRTLKPKSESAGPHCQRCGRNPLVASTVVAALKAAAAAALADAPATDVKA